MGVGWILPSLQSKLAKVDQISQPANDHSHYIIHSIIVSYLSQLLYAEINDIK
jgi:hypothetical protein